MRFTLTKWKRTIAGILVLSVGIGSSIFMLRSQDQGDDFLLPTISVPDELSQTIELVHKDGTVSHHVGGELYTEHFRNGWNDCVRFFVQDVTWGLTKAWLYVDAEGSDLGAPWIIDAPDEINDFRRSGWKACGIELQKKLQSVSESQLRASLARLSEVSPLR